MAGGARALLQQTHQQASLAKQSQSLAMLRVRVMYVKGCCVSAEGAMILVFTSSLKILVYRVVELCVSGIASDILFKDGDYR